MLTLTMTTTATNRSPQSFAGVAAAAAVVVAAADGGGGYAAAGFVAAAVAVGGDARASAVAVIVDRCRLDFATWSYVSSVCAPANLSHWDVATASTCDKSICATKEQM